MIMHSLRVAARGIASHKLYSLINIAGLAVGLTCVIFVVVFVRDQLSYDKWIPGTQNLYRLELSVVLPGRGPLPMAMIPNPMPVAMRGQIPGVTAMTRLSTWTKTLSIGARKISQDIDVVDPNFFTVIRLPLLRGDPATVFRQPDSVVLSESAARTYFGTADPIGRILTTEGYCGRHAATCPQVALRVTGVMRDLPPNTQLKGDVFIPTTSLANPFPKRWRQNWFYENGFGFVRLAPGVSPASVTAATAAIFDQDVTPELSKKAGVHVLGSKVYRAHLTPFRDVHLDSSRWEGNMKPPGSWSTLYGVATIGMLTLLVACFNFMNLTTARATLRTREIALRKLLGARRGQLTAQFLGEAVLISLLSLLLALALAEVLLPVFANFLRTPISLHYLTDWRLLLLLVGVAVVTGLISGSYPALVLSGFRPAAGLRSGDAGSARTGRLRNVLVVLQFAVSLGMGIAAAVVFGQVNYARHMNMGLHRRDIVIVGSNNHLTGKKEEAFADALRSNRGVIAVGLSGFVPFGQAHMTSQIQVPGQAARIYIDTTVIDPDYPKVYGIPIIAGRLLSATRGSDRMHRFGVLSFRDHLNDGRNVLVNAAAARRLGFSPQQAVGRTILFKRAQVRIVGVLADAKIHGTQEPAPAMVYIYVPSAPMSVSVRLRPGRIPQTLRFIDRTWHTFLPTVVEQRWFLEGSFKQLYRADQREGAMLGVFVVVALVIGCLGLYGLAVFTAERRTKEIGIRKVSGARTFDIVRLMLWRISAPVLISNLIAWPVAYGYLRQWLEGFAYHIALNPLYFVTAGVAGLLIAWATVYANTLRLARANPIRALRYE